MTVPFQILAHVETQRFNFDWSVVTQTYSYQTVTVEVPDGEEMFTIGDSGALDGVALADNLLTYQSVSGTSSVFLSNEHVGSVSQLSQPGGLVTDVMQFGIHVRGPDDSLLGFDNITIVLYGDPIPEFASLEAYLDWLGGTTGWWMPPATGPYAPGSTGNWGDFDIPSEILGTDGNDRLEGTSSSDTIRGGDGLDTLIGGDGDDFLYGGDSESDLRDVIYGGNGNDLIDGGYGNDELRGDAGMDTITGGFGVDDIFGGDGDDQLTGQAWSDLIFGGAGDDFINGGFGHDRVNGGPGADRFFHIGIFDHGSDWIQDYTAADGDVLQFGQAGTRDQFQVNFTETAGAGTAGVSEGFVIYRPTGQILWALVDGEAQSEINLLISGVTYDLLA